MDSVLKRAESKRFGELPGGYVRCGVLLRSAAFAEKRFRSSNPMRSAKCGTLGAIERDAVSLHRARKVAMGAWV
jgi:hypothetical protein